MLGLQALVALDYLIVHTADIEGPESLHPAENSRAAELLVRRRLVDSGLSLMAVRGLVLRRATPEGFRYAAGDEAGSFVDLLTSTYARALRDRADWLAQTVVHLSPSEFSELISSQFDRWDTEFQSDAGPGA